MDDDTGHSTGALTAGRGRATVHRRSPPIEISSDGNHHARDEPEFSSRPRWRRGTENWFAKPDPLLGVSSLKGSIDRTDYSRGFVLDLDAPVKILREAALDQTRSEALAGGRHHRRPARLFPKQPQASRITC